MNVLFGCEESQTMCMAFRAKGHDAFSNDLVECSGGFPEYHLQMDVFEAILLKKWNFIGLHPDCTKLTVTGNRHYGPTKELNYQRIQAIEWTIDLWYFAIANADFVYLENPIGVLNSDKRMPKPQIIHPYYFGDNAAKSTCLWLHNLPKLYHNKEVNLFDSNITHVSISDSRKLKTGGKKMSDFYYKTSLLKPELRKQVRSKSFPGIAEAMANQWINL